MVTQKSNQYQHARKQLDHIKKLNKALDIDRLKTQLFQIRTSELKILADAQLMKALFNYVRVSQKKIEKGRRSTDDSNFRMSHVDNMHLFELKANLEVYGKENIKDMRIDDMKPEIN